MSARALQVVAGTPPIHLQLEMVIRITNGMPKMESESICIRDWQIIWDNSSKGRWTYEIFPDIRQRIMTPITFDHYTTQIITGHWDFYLKLNGFNLVGNPLCSCGLEAETAEQILLAYPNKEPQRNKLKESLLMAGIVWSCEYRVFSSSKTAWSALERFAREALVEKEEDRRQERRMRQLRTFHTTHSRIYTVLLPHRVQPTLGWK